MKYLVTGYKENAEKQEIENKGLYCYDLRYSDEEGKIAAIEKNVVVNRIGSIITDKELKFGNKCYNNFIDFEEFSARNTEVYTIEQLQDKQKEKILRVKYIGIHDRYSRMPVYKDEKGIIYKDINLGEGQIKLCTAVNNDFYGEPFIPVREDVKIEIVKNFTRNKKGREAR